MNEINIDMYVVVELRNRKFIAERCFDEECLGKECFIIPGSTEKYLASDFDVIHEIEEIITEEE